MEEEASELAGHDALWSENGMCGCEMLKKQSTNVQKDKITPTRANFEKFVFFHIFIRWSIPGLAGAHQVYPFSIAHNTHWPMFSR